MGQGVAGAVVWHACVQAYAAQRGKVVRGSGSGRQCGAAAGGRGAGNRWCVCGPWHHPVPSSPQYEYASNISAISRHAFTVTASSAYMVRESFRQRRLHRIIYNTIMSAFHRGILYTEYEEGELWLVYQE